MASTSLISRTVADPRSHRTLRTSRSESLSPAWFPMTTPIAPGEHREKTWGGPNGAFRVPRPTSARTEPGGARRPTPRRVLRIKSDRDAPAGADSSLATSTSAEAYLQLVVARLLQAVEGCKGGFGRIWKILWDGSRTRKQPA